MKALSVRSVAALLAVGSLAFCSAAIAASHAPSSRSYSPASINDPAGDGSGVCSTSGCIVTICDKSGSCTTYWCGNNQACVKVSASKQ